MTPEPLCVTSTNEPRRTSREKERIQNDSRDESRIGRVNRRYRMVESQYVSRLGQKASATLPDWWQDGDGCGLFQHQDEAVPPLALQTGEVWDRDQASPPVALQPDEVWDRASPLVGFQLGRMWDRDRASTLVALQPGEVWDRVSPLVGFQPGGVWDGGNTKMASAWYGLVQTANLALHPWPQRWCDLRGVLQVSYVLKLCIYITVSKTRHFCPHQVSRTEHLRCPRVTSLLSQNHHGEK
jgi:hypothetical protein